MAPHIVMIDDQVNLSRFIAIELRAAGYQVSIQTDAIAECALIRALNPDLMILNWELRHASGPQIGRQLYRQLSWGDRPVPLIVVTTQDDIRTQLAMRMGAWACLTKPFSMDELLNAIEAQLTEPSSQSGSHRRYPLRASWGNWDVRVG